VLSQWPHLLQEQQPVSIPWVSFSVEAWNCVTTVKGLVVSMSYVEPRPFHATLLFSLSYEVPGP